MAALPSKTAQGADWWASADLKHLPREAYADLAKLCMACEESCTWPTQLLITIMAMLPKDSGGHRCVGLFPMLIRVYAKVRKHVVTSFDKGKQLHFDKAVAGSSALRAALARRFMEEARHPA